MIIEKSGGRYRILQSHIKNFDDHGYSAQEWCTLTSLPGRNKVHKTYGGGLTLGDSDMNKICDAIVGIQETIPLLIRHLMAHIPGIDPSAASILSRRDASKLSPAEVETATEAIQVSVGWSHQIQSLIGPLGITTLDESADPVLIFQGDRLLFEIPQKSSISGFKNTMNN
jgi:hypothetical protein